MCAHFAKGGSSESCLPLATVAVASTFQTTIARSILTTNRDERTVVGSKADSGNRSDVVERARARTGLLGAGVADKSHGSGCVTVGQERRRPRTVCGRHVNRAVTVEIA